MVKKRALGTSARRDTGRKSAPATTKVPFKVPISHSWILLVYKVPPEPAKRRIALWRKLKALGAVYLQNGVCLVPKSDEHVRRLKVLENDVSAMEGEAVLLETVGLDAGQEEKVVARFAKERNEAYIEFISRCDDFEGEIAKERGVGKFTYAEVEENEEDLVKLRAWLDKIIKLDFTGAPLRKQAEDRLAACAALLDDYAREVYEAQDEIGDGPKGSSHRD